jgi:hypothetical protein
MDTMNNIKKTFYVCTYGGCGSKMLCDYLKKFGNTIHVHSRNPPDKLQYIGGRVYHEWFNGIEIPEQILDNYYVIYIYKNPIYSIYSRFTNPAHLVHIQSDKNIKLNDVLTSKTDLYKIEEFYDNYTTKNENRNYKIYCVKYEGLFDNIPEFNKMFGLENNENLYPKKNERNHNYQHYDELEKIYCNLLEKMQNMDFITII